MGCGEISLGALESFLRASTREARLLHRFLVVGFIRSSKCSPGRREFLRLTANAQNLSHIRIPPGELPLPPSRRLDLQRELELSGPRHLDCG
jgi:hypothetical protein